MNESERIAEIEKQMEMVSLLLRNYVDRISNMETVIAGWILEMKELEVAHTPKTEGTN